MLPITFVPPSLQQPVSSPFSAEAKNTHPPREIPYPNSQSAPTHRLPLFLTHPSSTCSSVPSSMAETIKTHVILLSCGSFNPVTKGHIQMFGESINRHVHLSVFMGYFCLHLLYSPPSSTFCFPLDHPHPLFFPFDVHLSFPSVSLASAIFPLRLPCWHCSIMEIAESTDPPNQISLR